MNLFQRYDPGATRPSGDPLKLLIMLVDSGPKSVPDLITQSGMAFGDFSDVLKTMREAGLIVLRGTPGSEQVEATTSGEKVASLSR